MIQEVIVKTCGKCGSANIVKNGRNKSNNPRYKCKSVVLVVFYA